MRKLYYHCKHDDCLRLTVHIVRIVDDRLPPYVHVLMCTSCGQECVVPVDIDAACLS
jgi:hypothetical protein